MISKILKIAKPVLVAIVGVILTNTFNIFSYIEFIPSEHSFDICITAYFAILEILSESIIEIINSKFRSELSVVFSLPGTANTLSSIPVVTFNKLDLAELNVTIILNGRKKHFEKSQIVIPNINFATMQASIKSHETHTDNKGNYIINLSELFGNTDKKISLSFTYRLTFVQEQVEADREIELYPDFVNNTKLKLNPFVIYKCNNSKIQAKG